MNRNSHSKLNAFTLVELLVALTIALVLTAVALPRVREAMQQNVASRSATLVKSVLENARTNAIRTGRPYGVILERVTNEVTPGDSTNDPLLIAEHGANYCRKLSFAQVPFEYRGDVSGAVLTLNTSVSPPCFEADIASCGLLYAVASNQLPESQKPFGIGSLIKIGNERAPGVITDLQLFPTTSPTVVRVYVRESYPTIPGTLITSSGQVPFTIPATPVASPLPPLELPGKTAIDLSCSGFSTAPYAFGPYGINLSTNAVHTPPMLYNGNPGYRNVVIMFNPLGQLDAVYLDRYISGTSYSVQRVDAIGPISLLIGEINGVVRPLTVGRYPSVNPNTSWPTGSASYNYNDRRRPNFANSNATWLSINPSSGKIILNPVAAPLQDENSAHPELMSSHTPAVLVRDRLLDSQRLNRGRSL